MATTTTEQPGFLAQNLLGDGLTAPELSQRQQAVGAGAGAVLGLLGAGLTARKKDGALKTLARLGVGTAAGAGIGYGAAVGGQALAKADNPALILGGGAMLGGLALLAGQRLRRGPTAETELNAPDEATKRKNRFTNAAGWGLLAGGGTLAALAAVALQPSKLRDVREWVRKVNDTDYVDKLPPSDLITAYTEDAHRMLNTRVGNLVPAGDLMMNARTLNDVLGTHIPMDMGSQDHYSGFIRGPVTGRMALYREWATGKNAPFNMAAEAADVALRDKLISRPPEDKSNYFWMEKEALPVATQRAIWAAMEKEMQKRPDLAAHRAQMDNDISTWIKPHGDKPGAFREYATQGAQKVLNARDNALVYGATGVGLGGSLLAAVLLDRAQARKKRTVTEPSSAEAVRAYKEGRLNDHQLLEVLNRNRQPA